MSETRPSVNSVRTINRATALTWARGCEQWNDCWGDCYSSSLDRIVEGRLDDDEREWASSSAYWHATHAAQSSPSPERRSQP